MTEKYVALYIGIAVHSGGLQERIKWHVSQKHTFSSVKSNYISTLRKTLSGILCAETPDLSEKMVNDFMDTHCVWEWEYSTNAEAIEKSELSFGAKYVYPLNIFENEGISKDVKEKLKSVRQQFKNNFLKNCK